MKPFFLILLCFMALSCSVKQNDPSLPTGLNKILHESVNSFSGKKIMRVIDKNGNRDSAVMEITDVKKELAVPLAMDAEKMLRTWKYIQDSVRVRDKLLHCRVATDINAPLRVLITKTGEKVNTEYFYAESYSEGLFFSSKTVFWVKKGDSFGVETTDRFISPLSFLNDKLSITGRVIS